MKRRQRIWLPLWTALWVALSLSVFVRWQPIEIRWSRLTEMLRDPLVRINSPNVPIDSHVVLVMVDDASLAAYKEPTTYWLPYFGKAIRTCLDANAAAVGLDWMVYDIDERVYQAVFQTPGQSEPLHPWNDLGMAVIAHPDHWVQGVFPNLSGKNVEAGRAAQGDYRPAPELSSLAGGANLGYLNLSRDLDGILRRQVIMPEPVDVRSWGVSQCSSFVGRLAELKGIDLAKVPNLEPGGLLRIAYADPTAIPHLSLHQVIEMGQKDPARLKALVGDKAVIIGVGTLLFHDRVETPIGEIWGVEAHALTLNTLLTRTFWRHLSFFSQLLLVWLFGFLAGLAGARWKPVSVIVSQLALASAAVLLSYFALSRLSTMLDAAQLMVAIFLCGSIGWVIQWTRQEREQREVRTLFGRYVSAAVMEELLKDPTQAVLGAVGRREITVLFSDINGFSTLCEKSTPEEVMNMLNAYFQEMNKIIFRHGGTIKQFVGDEIMVMYGAPTPHETPERSAVLTAVEMIRRLRAMEAADPTGAGFYHVKIGIHRGSVILGNVGSIDRTEYAAVGDDVNLGSRIMSMTKPLGAEILISGEVLKHLQGLTGIHFESKGKHQVKGRDEPVDLYEVVVD